MIDAPRRLALASALVCALGGAAAPGALAQNTPARPRPYAVQGVRLSAAEDAPRKTLLLRDGRIEAIQDAGLELPGDVWVLEVDGLVAVPGFLDAWTRTGCETTPPEAEQDRPTDTSANVRVDMRQANRKGIQPAFHAAEVFALDEKAAEAHREAGFAVLLSAPGGELLAGRSALVVARDAAPRDLIVRDGVFQHAAFDASGGGYPGTLMAYHAQLRQVFHDARHRNELVARQQAGRPGPRPAWDPDLEAAGALLSGTDLLVCEAETAADVQRWLRLADEFGLRIAIAGGRDAWKVADELARRDMPVFMTLEWGDEVDDPDAEETDSPGVPVEAEPERPRVAEQGEEVVDPEELPEEPTEEEAAEEEDAEEEDAEELDFEYFEPVGVLREKRRLWEERRDSASRLHEAGVRVVFCTGERKASELLAAVRELVESGFPREAALAALTSQPAELLGADRHFGWLRQGHSATFSLWTGDPLAEDTQVKWSFVEGYPAEFEVKEKKAAGDGPADGVDLGGTWTVTFPDEDDGRDMTLELEMAEDGTVTGDAATTSPMDDSPLAAEVDGVVDGTTVSLSMTFVVGEFSVELEFEGELDGDTLKGTRTLKFPGNEDETRFEAVRTPGQGGQQ